MTLILSVVTRDLIVQVADRRLTWLTGPNAGHIVDDKRNKMVVVCNRLVFAYSGLAEIGSANTDQWLLDTVARIDPYSVTSILHEVRIKAELAFSSINRPFALKRHAFVAAGWARQSADGSLHPFLWSISNALDDGWRWKPAAGDRFITRQWTLPTAVEMELVDTGVTISPKIRLETERRLRACLNHDAGPEAYVRVLVEAIREVARVSPTVGEDLLAVVLPIAATNRPTALAGVFTTTPTR